MARALSVVIPSRNELQNLLWTLQTLQLELRDVDAEVVVVLNQCDEVEHERLAKLWPAQTGWLKVVRYDDKPSCWQARNAGIQASDGQHIMFMDSHAMVRPGDLVQALEYHQGFDGLLHLGVNWWMDHPARTVYHYKWRPDKFWGDWTRIEPVPPDYHILMAGMHFMVDCDTLAAIGGFHPALGIYGGGEPYVWLKAQRLGYDTRCVPDWQVYHLAEKRGYSWNQADLWRNFMVAAWAVGGEEALNPLVAHYRELCGENEEYLASLARLRAEAVELAEDDRLETEARAVRTYPDIVGGRNDGNLE